MTMATSKAQTNGVLSINASQTSGNNAKSTAATVKGPNVSPKLKIIVRRLPPGLTELEFATTLGEDWKVGKGRVDWFLYKPGKDSKDPSKPSRPSRAYLHLTNESHLLNLSDTVRQSTFEDALNTITNSCLIGPPTVEFAPYGRTPGGRRRVDARAGTIDQDPEFMAFLEALANPTNAKETNGSEGAGTEERVSGKGEKVTTTPLVQYLKDKKASKHKEVAAKAAKKQEAQLAKSKTIKDSPASPEDLKKKGKDVKAERPVDKAAKEAVKILNREAASKASSSSSAATSKPEAGSESTGPPKLDLGKVAGRQRGAVVAAHIRMLQRDLGLTPAQAHRQVRRDTADAQKAEKAAVTEKTEAETKLSTPQASATPSIPTAPKSSFPQPRTRGPRHKGPSADPQQSSQPVSVAGPSTPVLLLKKPDTPVSTPPTSLPAKPPAVAVARKPPVSVPSDGVTQAFVKHANPSQGVTEPLLKEALEKFGPVASVEIDKRKGFAYVEFADNEGLRKAMAANPIAVAQGTVHVLQRKGTASAPERKPTPQIPTAPANRGGRGGGGRGNTTGRRGGRGGGRGGANSEAPRAPASTPTGPSAK